MIGFTSIKRGLQGESERFNIKVSLEKLLNTFSLSLD